MKCSTVLAFCLGVVVASGGTYAVAASGASGKSAPAPRVTLVEGHRVLMPELRWECVYTRRGLGVLSGAPPGPEFRCGRLGAWTGGIRTATDLYYVVVWRGTNTSPVVLSKQRRP
jgi:hypothetical protein